MRIYFYGAARFVTGSNHYIETKNNEKFLLDCGLFQGTKEEEAVNYKPFPYDVKDLDFVLLSHSHIDHSGRLPKLVKDGFKGKIYSTPATYDLAEIMLKDSATIHEDDAKWANRKRQRKNKKPVEALYTKEDVNAALELFETHPYGEIFDVSENIKVRFQDAGHVLGSAITEFWVTEAGKTAKFVYTGDLGTKDHALIKDPSYIDSADVLISESTYGNTIHEDYSNSLENLMDVIEDVTSKGGTVVIPSFAVGRTQEIIYELNNQYEYKYPGRQSKIKFYVDSPLAVNATKVFMKNSYVFNEKAQKQIIKGDNIFDFPNLHYTKTVDESKSLNSNMEPKVIISASGMATGGRVVHHLKHNLWKTRNAVIFVGYQAQGTAGQLIKDGISKIKLAGEWVANRAQIYDMQGFSAHADQDDILDWLDHFKEKPKKIFLVHGDDDEMYPLKKKIEEKFKINVDTPKLASYTDINFENLEDSRTLDTKESEILDTTRENIFIEKKLHKIQYILAELADRDIDLSNLNAEEKKALEQNLFKLEDQLMEFNIISGE